MNLARLQKQLAKDVKKSPGKAAALGLLTLVALYAWAPLLFRENTASEPAQGHSIATPPVPTQTAATNQIVAAHLPASWRQLASWIDKDPRMKPAVGELERMNPFSTLSPPATDARTSDADPGEQNYPTQVVDPRSLGLIVSGTMLGRHRRVAVVNGRPYVEGRQLQLGPDVTFTLAQVGVRHIVLERDGRQFDLPVAAEGSQQSSP